MKIYNTLSGQKQDFAPQGDTVKMYVCGITPYAPSHLGHAMSYIIFDTIRRYLEYRGHNVRYIQNFTDIDDKIIAQAHELNVAPAELAESHIAAYGEDMRSLNIKAADHYPRATEEIPKIVELIEGLIGRGHAYEVDSDVYFRVASDPGYGKLSRRSLDDMMAGARVEVSEAKEHPLDFALWKAAKPGEPRWESPWGEGRPGWHIECSAMALKYLGETIDIHGGGQDLIFPHHENEIAQTESFTGVKPFVRYWLHNGLMQLGEDKMSKSSGRLVTIGEALDRHSADAIRLWVLGSHYRSPITYTEDVVSATERGLERLIRAAHVQLQASGVELDPEPYRQQFVASMEDDFNTPQAVAALFDLARELNRAHSHGHDVREAHRILRELAGVLGLILDPRRLPELPGDLTQPLVQLAVKYGLAGDDPSRPDPVVQALIEKRLSARQEKDWQLADSIRADLRELGITLEDTSEGTLHRYGKP
jgi:cysteinyl-tRNA synthetase